MDNFGKSWLQKSLALIAVLYAIINSFFVVYKLHYLNLNISRTPNVLHLETKFDDRTKGLAWFVHASDLHFSKFVDLDRPKDFLELCQFVNKVINPQAVILTGDLTDAKAKDKLGSRQFIEEWQMYQETMEICGAYKKDAFWLDVRGNHDTFNTRNMEEDFYRYYNF